MRIMFIRLRSLGDIVLMTPVLTVARRKSGSVIGVVCETPFDRVLRGNPDIDLLITASRRRAWRSRVKVIREIRRFKPDLVIDLHGGTTSSLMTGLSGAARRIGYSTARNAFLYSEVIPDTRQIWGREQIHTVEHQLAPLKYLGFPIEPVPPLRVPLNPQELQYVRELLSNDKGNPLSEVRSSVSAELEGPLSHPALDRARQGPKDLLFGQEELAAPIPFILVHPAAAFETKQWPVERFGELIERLANEGHRVIATSGPGQFQHLEQLSQLVDGDFTVVPPLPLERFIALASLCSVYVGNDTGTTHIAAALKKPIVVIFGSSDSAVWYPWDVEYVLVKSDLPCIPCPGYSCGEYDEPLCIKTVPVDEVFQAVKRFIE